MRNTMAGVGGTDFACPLFHRRAPPPPPACTPGLHLRPVSYSGMLMRGALSQRVSARVLARVLARRTLSQRTSQRVSQRVVTLSQRVSVPPESQQIPTPYTEQ